MTDTMVAWGALGISVELSPPDPPPDGARCGVHIHIPCTQGSSHIPCTHRSMVLAALSREIVKLARNKNRNNIECDSRIVENTQCERLLR